MKQLFSVVKYLHDLGIVHRDIKPENILFQNRNQFHVITLVDYGSAAYISDLGKPPSWVAEYTAPEALGNNYTEKCDL